MQLTRWEMSKQSKEANVRANQAKQGAAKNLSNQKKIALQGRATQHSYFSYLAEADSLIYISTLLTYTHIYITQLESEVIFILSKLHLKQQLLSKCVFLDPFSMSLFNIMKCAQVIDLQRRKNKEQANKYLHCEERLRQAHPSGYAFIRCTSTYVPVLVCCTTYYANYLLLLSDRNSRS